MQKLALAVCDSLQKCLDHGQFLHHSSMLRSLWDYSAKFNYVIMCQFEIRESPVASEIKGSSNNSTHPVWYELPLLDSDRPDIRQGEGVGPLVCRPHQVAEEPQIGSLVDLNIIFTKCEYEQGR